MLDLFARPRMLAVQQFFLTETDNDLFGCYAWAQAVSSGLFPLLADFEVTIRNALHRALSQYYGKSDSFDWMMARPNPAQKKNPYAKPLPALHRMNPQMQRDIENIAAKVKGKKGAVTCDDVVASLTFGFWEQLINSLDHKSHPPGLQKAILSSAFPHSPDLVANPYGSAPFKTRLVTLLGRIRETRNRIGHHDSIWAIPEFDDQGTIGFIPRRPRHTVASLTRFSEQLCWLTGWVSHSIPSHIQSSDHWWSFHALLSKEALAVYRRMGGKIGTYKAVIERAPKRKERMTGGRSKTVSRSHTIQNLMERRFHY